jgi:methyl-accepting chemotaxis protein
MSNFKKKMNIQQKLTYGFTVLLCFIVAISILAVIGENTLYTRVKNLANKSEVANEAIKLCRIDTNIAARNVREMVLTDDTSTYPSYNETISEKFADIAVQIEKIQKTKTIPDSQLEEYYNALLEWEEVANNIVDMIEAGNRQEAVTAILNDCTPRLESMVTLANDLDEEIETKVNSYVSGSRLIFYSSTIVLVVATLVAAFLSIRLAKEIIDGIMVPLKEIEGSAKALAQGDLHTHISYQSDDELGVLADSLRSSISTLSTYVDNISLAMGEFAGGNFDVDSQLEWKGDFMPIYNAIASFRDTMTDTINGIRDVAERVENGAGQVSSTSMDLAQGATDQASVMQEFTATVETISEQVSANADYANDISKRVENVGVKIQDTNEKMQVMVKSMSEIGESSKKIGKIIDVINDIAAQTNLLALNASIEAARAGEAGRGFSVVANQVTALATQSSEAVKESTTLIEASIREVENGMQITEEIAEKQKQVVDDAQTIVEEVNNVADALKAQSDSFDQLNIGISQINDVIQTNSATSEECAASSQEMSDEASTLDGLIKGFKTKR